MNILKRKKYFVGTLCIIMSLTIGMAFSSIGGDGVSYGAKKASKKPTKPTYVKVNNETEKSLYITWGKSKKATHYQIYRAAATKNSSGKYKLGKYKKIKTIKAFSEGWIFNSENKREFTDTKMKAATKYYYKVRGINGKNKSAFTKPKAKMVTPGSIVAKSEQYGRYSLKVYWNKAKYATKYKVYKCYGNTGDFSHYALITTTTDRKYIDADLDLRHDYDRSDYYYYVVVPYNDTESGYIHSAYSDNWTNTSIKDDFNDGLYPLTPVIQYSDGLPNNTAHIEWSLSINAKTYEVWRSLNRGEYEKIATTTGRSYDDKNLRIGGYDEYRYKILGVNGNYRGHFSDYASFHDWDWR